MDFGAAHVGGVDETSGGFVTDVDVTVEDVGVELGEEVVDRRLFLSVCCFHAR